MIALFGIFVPPEGISKFRVFEILDEFLFASFRVLDKNKNVLGWFIVEEL